MIAKNREFLRTIRFLSFVLNEVKNLELRICRRQIKATKEK